MTTIRTTVTTLCLAAALATPTLAQDHDATSQMTPEQLAEVQAYIAAGTPGAPHEAMAKTVGRYDLAVKSWPAPGAPAVEEKATATRTMILDGRVLVEEIVGTMMGMSYTGRRLEGYDNVTGEQWSIWIDNMSTGMMLSRGDCDEDGTCTFTGSWNDPITEEPKTVRMTSRWTGPRTMTFEMFGPGPEGEEYKMMEIVYTKAE